MILELHERDTEVLEQILSILKNHPEIEKIEVDEEPMVSLPGLEIFPSRRKVFRDRQEIQLTAKEYRILLLLAANKGRVLTYAQIYEQVWGDFTTGNENNQQRPCADLRTDLRTGLGRFHYRKRKQYDRFSYLQPAREAVSG